MKTVNTISLMSAVRWTCWVACVWALAAGSFFAVLRQAGASAQSNSTIAAAATGLNR